MVVANDVCIPLSVVATLFPAGLTAKSLSMEIGRQSASSKDLVTLWRRAMFACEVEHRTKKGTAK